MFRQHGVVPRDFSTATLANYDVALHKVTKVAESTTLEICFEMFNAFNHAQFFGAGSVHGNISSATFGYVIHAAPPQVSQMVAKFSF